MVAFRPRLRGWQAAALGSRSARAGRVAQAGVPLAVNATPALVSASPSGKILMEDGASRILMEDGTFVLEEG